jgi:hypothetical protein
MWAKHKMSERDMTAAAKCKYLALKQKCVSLGSSSSSSSIKE